MGRKRKIRVDFEKKQNKNRRKIDVTRFADVDANPDMELSESVRAKGNRHANEP